MVVPQDDIHDVTTRPCRGTGGANPSEARRTCCRDRLHGMQRSGTHTASCGGARSRLLHAAGRSRCARGRAAAPDAWRADSRCSSGPFTKNRGTGEFHTALSAHAARHCAARRWQSLLALVRVRTVSLLPFSGDRIITFKIILSKKDPGFSLCSALSARTQG
jgi:hypothetical protein